MRFLREVWRVVSVCVFAVAVVTAVTLLAVLSAVAVSAWIEWANGCPHSDSVRWDAGQASASVTDGRPTGCGRTARWGRQAGQARIPPGSWGSPAQTRPLPSHLQ